MPFYYDYVILILFANFDNSDSLIFIYFLYDEDEKMSDITIKVINDTRLTFFINNFSLSIIYYFQVSCCHLKGYKI